MNYIYSNGEYTVYDNSVKSFNKLPAGMYRISFNQNTGWKIINDYEFKIEEKIYGDHQRKANKVINTFDVFPRNLGVLLSGSKGMGKSLVCKLICNGMIKKGYPVITVDNYIPGISKFLHKIDTESVIYLDEFDKMFYQSDDCGNDSIRPQDEMLSLFDGLDTNKKMFLVTCNKITDISNYFINRPGRFHYHFRFTYPTSKEIEEYLSENVKKKYYNEIINVLAFSQKVKLNYDCLRSIAFELNLGNSFYDFIDDLNILRTNDDYFDIKLSTDDGRIFETSTELDLISEEKTAIRLYGEDDSIKISFVPSDLVYNEKNRYYTIKNLESISVSSKQKINKFIVKSRNENIYSYFSI